jgi:hypothetical protein
VVFSNLDLRLDVLEKELGLPFTFVSGHIHELHINVPWTRLNTEPIVITINTIECVLRLPDSSNSSQDGSEASAKSSTTDKKRSSRRSPAKQQGTIHILRKHMYTKKINLTTLKYLINEYSPNYMQCLPPNSCQS